VELDGVSVGATPLEKKFPGGYFHRTKTKFGQRLEHPMVRRKMVSVRSPLHPSPTRGNFRPRKFHGNARRSVEVQRLHRLQAHDRDSEIQQAHSQGAIPGAITART
jgi:hypothetical protein